MTVLDDLFLITGYEIQVVLATRKEMEWALHHYYLPKEQLEAFVSLKETEGLGNEELGDEQVEHAPTIALVESIISTGIARRASDIHIEPHQFEVLIRYRIDGMLYDIMSIPNHLRANEYVLIAAYRSMVERIHQTFKQAGLSIISIGIEPESSYRGLTYTSMLKPERGSIFQFFSSPNSIISSICRKRLIFPHCLY